MRNKRNLKGQDGYKGVSVNDDHAEQACVLTENRRICDEGMDDRRKDPVHPGRERERSEESD